MVSQTLCICAAIFLRLVSATCGWLKETAHVMMVARSHTMPTPIKKFGRLELKPVSASLIPHFVPQSAMQVSAVELATHWPKRTKALGAPRATTGRIALPIFGIIEGSTQQPREVGCTSVPGTRCRRSMTILAARVLRKKSKSIARKESCCVMISSYPFAALILHNTLKATMIFAAVSVQSAGEHTHEFAASSRSARARSTFSEKSLVLLQMGCTALRAPLYSLRIRASKIWVAVIWEALEATLSPAPTGEIGVNIRIPPTALIELVVKVAILDPRSLSWIVSAERSSTPFACLSSGAKSSGSAKISFNWKA
mmetsp:Transcript_145952/g.406581  ORF Transcript_145952/g.406581 Transcript_145952/m.406581 type:complete len:312 (+) Transcript_145952:288-1223(+)